MLHPQLYLRPRTGTFFSQALPHSPIEPNPGVYPPYILTLPRASVGDCNSTAASMALVNNTPSTLFVTAAAYAFHNNNNNPRTWNSLPTEMVALIFRYAISNEPDRKVNLVLSHTCRLWREIALTSPLLWQSIEFTTSYDPEYRWPGLCLARSKKCAIDITITREALQFDDDDDDEDDPQLVEKAAARLIALLSPESSRWRTVNINLPNPHLYNLLHDCLPRAAASAWSTATLNSLTLTCDRNNQLNVPALVFPPGYGRGLTRLVLNTLNVDWKQWDFTNLKYLELARHDRDHVRPRLPELHDMLSRTPLLEELHFNGSGVWADDHEATSWKRFVTLKKLHTLTIARQVSCGDVAALIHLLRAPHLDKLIISEWRGDEYDRAITLLGSPDSGAGTGFPSITYLHLRGIDMSDSTYGMDAFGEFLRSITKVTHLFAELHGMNPLSLLPLTDPAPHLRYPAPALQCFQVTGPHRGCIGRMVEARKAIGRPMKKLILGRLDTKITKEFNERLESMVETVLYVEPTDDDDAGCEGSDYEDHDEDDDDDDDDDDREYEDE